MYKIIFTQRAIRDLESLNKQIQNRIVNKLKEYAEEPIKYAHKLTNPEIGTYRFRIGDYRVVFDIENKAVVILRIGHRKHIYK